MLTYTIIDWTKAPGPRVAHERFTGEGQSPLRVVVDWLCAELDEQPCRAIRRKLGRIVKILGDARVQELVHQAKEIHAGPGMLVNDGSRRRTLGGAFFKLAKQGGVSEPVVSPAAAKYQ